MSIQTTIQGMFSQLPRLAHSLLQVVLDNSPTLANSFQLRLVCEFPDVIATATQNFDLPIHSSVTLEEIMHEYIPGTFQLSFRLLYNGKPVNLAALILQHLDKSYHDGPKTGQPVRAPLQQAVHRVDPPGAQHIHSNQPARRGQSRPSRASLVNAAAQAIASGHQTGRCSDHMSPQHQDFSRQQQVIHFRCA